MSHKPIIDRSCKKGKEMIGRVESTFIAQIIMILDQHGNGEKTKKKVHENNLDPDM